jgi:hypothetical protein
MEGGVMLESGDEKIVKIANMLLDEMQAQGIETEQVNVNTDRKDIGEEFHSVSIHVHQYMGQKSIHIDTGYNSIHARNGL